MTRRSKMLFGLMAFSVVLAIAFVPGPNSAYSSGFSGSASTGCGGCHDQELESSVDVTIIGIPTEYTAQQTYQLTITVSGEPIGDKGGFDLAVDKGTFINPGSNATLESDKEVVHSDSGSRTWTVDWVAPQTGSGTATFEIAGMVADGTSAMDTDRWNLASYTTVELGIVNNPPTNVAISSDKDTAFVGEEISFGGTATDTDLDPLIYNWSFGDDSIVVAGQNVKHKYDQTGTFTVVLTVDDGHGHVESQETSITIKEKPDEGFVLILTIVAVVVALIVITFVMKRVFLGGKNE